MQLLQLGPRPDPQFGEEQLPDAAEHRQRVRLPTGLVQRPHQQSVGPLVQRVLGSERGQLRDAPRVAAEREVQADPLLQQGQPQLLQALPVPLRERPGDPGQRLALPELQRLVEQVAGAQGIGPGGPLRLGGQRLGLLRVHRELGQDEPVAVPHRHQGAARGLLAALPTGLLAGLPAGVPLPGDHGVQDLPPPPRVRPHGGHRRPRRLLAPQRRDQIRGAGRVAGPQ